MGSKIDAEAISEIFNLAALKSAVQQGYGFIVALPPRQGGAEAFNDFCAAKPDIAGTSAYVEVPTAIAGVSGEAALFRTDKAAQDFCDFAKGIEPFGPRLEVSSLAVSPENGIVVAAPLDWDARKRAAIEKMMRK